MKIIKEKSLIIQPKAADVARRIPHGIRLAAELGHSQIDRSEQDREDSKPEEQVEDGVEQSALHATNLLGSKFKRSQERLKNPFQINRVRSNQVSYTGKSGVTTVQPRHNTLHPTAKSVQTKGANFLKFQNSASNSIAKTARSIIQKVVVSIKSVVAGLKDIGTIIAAGGWAAVALIIALAIICWVLTTPAGIFAGGRYEDDPARSVYIVLDELAKEVDDRINEIIEEHGEGCEISIQNEDGNDDILEQVGPLVLAVYAVTVSTDQTEPDQVATLDARKEAVLRNIFGQSVLIDFKIQKSYKIQSDTDSVETRNLIVNIDCLSMQELILQLGFCEEQSKLVQDLMGNM